MIPRIQRLQPLARHLSQTLRFTKYTQPCGRQRLETTYAAPSSSINPAYAEALKVIESSKNEALKEADQVKENVKKLESQDPKNPEIEKLNKRLDELLVKAYIENGEVLWNARNGKFDLNQPVYRHLKEKFWKQRPLDILMQRVTQMYVIPDAIDPKIFNIPSTCLDLTLKGWNEGKPIEPGAIVPPETALELPTMNLTAFHEDVRLYTIIMADLDHPNEETQSYQQQCHWMGCNIPISMHDGNIKAENAVLPYIPPHPAKGTKRHRYVFLVMQQGEKGQVRLENVKLDRAVHLRTLASELSLRPVGVSFFRSEWNETVDEVYRQHLGLEPPVYGPAPAATRFDEGTVGSQKKAFGKYANA